MQFIAVSRKENREMECVQAEPPVPPVKPNTALEFVPPLPRMEDRFTEATRLATRPPCWVVFNSINPVQALYVRDTARGAVGMVET